MHKTIGISLWTLWLAMVSRSIWLIGEEPRQTGDAAIRFERRWRAGVEYEYRLTYEVLEVQTGGPDGAEPYVMHGPNAAVKLALKVLPQEAGAKVRNVEVRILSLEAWVPNLGRAAGQEAGGVTGASKRIRRADLQAFAEALSEPLVAELDEKGRVIAVRGLERYAALLRNVIRKHAAEGGRDSDLQALRSMAEARWMCAAIQWCFPTLPEAPVRPGDSWETDERLAVLGGFVRLRGRNELAMRVPVSGQWCHRVDAVLDVAFVDPEPPTRVGPTSVETEKKSCRRRVWVRDEDGITARQETDLVWATRVIDAKGTDLWRGERRTTWSIELVR